MSDELDRRLRAHVDALADDIGERHVRRPQALHAAERYIGDTLRGIGRDVVRQSYEVDGIVCSNLETAIPGSDAGAGIVLAGAHYDTVPGSPGADDNASGVAALIEIARLLSGTRPSRTIRLVAFVNEEPPFFYFGEMGSKVYARAARERGDDIRVMLSLEMLGCFSDRPGSQRYPPLLRWLYPDRGDFIAFVSNVSSRHALRRVVAAFRASTDFPAESLAAPAIVPGVSWSDQLSFWREGYPAVMVTDTAFYRNPNYHLGSDVPRTLDYVRMGKLVHGLAGCLATLASPG